MCRYECVYLYFLPWPHEACESPYGSGKNGTARNESAHTWKLSPPWANWQEGKEAHKHTLLLTPCLMEKEMGFFIVFRFGRFKLMGFIEEIKQGVKLQHSTMKQKTRSTKQQYGVGVIAQFTY